MKTRHSTLLMLTLLGAASLTLGARPGHAITLEQKWQKGTQYTYDFAMQGDATLMTDAPNFPLANMPIPVKVKGVGQLTLDTKEVDADGTGSVVPTLTPFNLDADAMGQKFKVQLKSDKTLLLWNGRTAWTGPNPPAAAFKIQRDGKLIGITPLAPAPATAAPNANGQPATGDKPTAGANPFGAMLQNVVLRALPALWPGHEVQEGEAWSVDVPRPVVGNAAPTNAKPLGKFDFKLGPEEKIGDRMARRVAVTGSVKYDGDAVAAAEGENAPAAGAAPPMLGKLESSSQKVTGNLWFDPTLGQVVRAELEIQSDIKGNATQGKAKNPANATFGFAGTLQMQLKNVVEAGAGNG